ncbi:MAG: GNAT family N-acetyltransferase [Planctomycetes bacterium]|nr:GNAT family N-acetyltransferase [Planctomycetota bacterium]
MPIHVRATKISRATTRPAITIRLLERLEEFRICEALQKEVWSFADIDIVPARLLAAMSKSGAIVLGAFRGRRPVGFAFGFPGWRQGRHIWCSHMLAVVAEERDACIGYRLKLEQRQRLLDRPIDLVTWTFDPLESRNANLNVAKLGCVAWEYWVNLYGRTSSPLHRGLDTDRVVPRWYIRSKRVTERLAGRAPRASFDDATPILESREIGGGLIAPGRARLNLRAPVLSLEVPAETAELRLHQQRIARRWQLTVRRALQTYFARGYALTDVVSFVDAGRRRAFYLLDRDVRREIERGWR